MPKVVYLTGIPGTGKTTLGQALETTSNGAVAHVSYSEMLAARVESTTQTLRSRSDVRVTRELVRETDEELVRLVEARRAGASVVIDSHAVTYKPYGLRVIPFESRQLAALGLDAVVCLTAPAGVILGRIEAAPEGRPPLQLSDVEAAARAQEVVAASYATQLGVPLYLVDADRRPDEVASTVGSILRA